MARWETSPWGEVDEFDRHHPPSRHYKAIVWPHGGQRRTKWGRFKDVARGRGPDMWISTNPNRPVNASDGPTKRRWTNFPLAEYDDKTRNIDHAGLRPPLKHARRIPNHKIYDFRSRKYRRPSQGMWTDAWYRPGSRTPTRIETFPWGEEHDIYGAPPGTLDPRNFGTQRPAWGVHGIGGYWHPRTEPNPPMQHPLDPEIIREMELQGLGGPWYNDIDDFDGFDGFDDFSDMDDPMFF